MAEFQLYSQRGGIARRITSCSEVKQVRRIRNREIINGFHGLTCKSVSFFFAAAWWLSRLHSSDAIRQPQIRSHFHPDDSPREGSVLTFTPHGVAGPEGCPRPIGKESPWGPTRYETIFPQAMKPSLFRRATSTLWVQETLQIIGVFVREPHLVHNEALPSALGWDAGGEGFPPLFLARPQNRRVALFKGNK